MELKTVEQSAADLKAAQAELGRINTQHHEASVKARQLADQIAGIDHDIDDALNWLAQVEAARQLGDAVDIDAASEQLKAARKRGAVRDDLIHQQRVALAVVEQIERRLVDARNAHHFAQEAHRQAVVAELDRIGRESVAEANELIDQLVSVGVKLYAVRILLNEKGSRLDVGHPQTHKLPVAPGLLIVGAHVEHLRQELSA